MSLATYILTARIHGKNISGLESFAYSCLSPARYFWNGREVDLIQKYSMDFAVQMKLSYPKNQHYSWFKTAIMVVFLIPGVIIGGAINLALTWPKRHSKEVVFIQNNLNGNLNCVIGPNQEFNKEVKDFIKGIKAVDQHLKTFLPLFLSSVTSFRLPEVPDQHQFSRQAIVKKHTEILDRIYLLWNLKDFILSHGNELSWAHKHHINQINPIIWSLRSMGGNRVDLRKLGYAKKLNHFHVSEGHRF